MNNKPQHRLVSPLVALALALLLVPLVRAEEGKIGRPVRIVTLSFPAGKSVDEIAAVVDREAAAGVDLLVLPETWTGKTPEPLDGPATTAMAALARKHHTYIVNPIYRKDAQRVFNSAVLLDRNGAVACIYDKIWVFPPEFATEYLGRTYNAVKDLQCGRKPVVFETDFGKVGFAICFDINFPDLWQRMADAGAELVVWPSAYPGGLSLQVHGAMHHYYIVAATHNHRPTKNCPVIDITGHPLADPGIPQGKTGDINIARFTLDLDRTLFTNACSNPLHAKELLKAHPNDVEMEPVLPHEGWFILHAKRPGVSARQLAQQYGLREQRAWLREVRRELDQYRGGKSE